MDKYTGMTLPYTQMDNNTDTTVHRLDTITHYTNIDGHACRKVMMVHETMYTDWHHHTLHQH